MISPLFMAKNISSKSILSLNDSIRAWSLTKNSPIFINRRMVFISTNLLYIKKYIKSIKEQKGDRYKKESEPSPYFLGKLTFNGGLHLKEQKHRTENKSIRELSLPRRVVIPLSQHTGRPSVPIVSKGDTVLCGQKIGNSEGKISAVIHSSISGKVVDICLWNHPIIKEPVTSIVIESDGLDSHIESQKKYADYYRYSADELRDVIKEAGIVGMGGAAFPTHVKLSPPTEVDTILLNGCECEPFLTCDDKLMQEYPKDIIEGLKIMMYVLDIYSAVVVIEDNKKKAIESISKIIFNEPNIRLEVIKTKYPQGAEKQLIKAVLRRTVPSGKLPFDVGVLVQNVGTSLAICNAVKNAKPLTSRVVTVTGDCIEEPGNYLVRIGTLLSDLLEECGYVPNNKHKVILGGPAMGIAQGDLNVPVIKGTSGILVVPLRNQTYSEFYSCIRCGKCIDVCPMELMPNMISISVESELWEQAAVFSPSDCIECGCCAYECVAKRPLVQHIKLAKRKSPSAPL